MEIPNSNSREAPGLAEFAGVFIAISAIIFMLHLAVLVIGYNKICRNIEKCSCKNGKVHDSKPQIPMQDSAWPGKQDPVMGSARKMEVPEGDMDISSDSSDNSEHSRPSSVQTPKRKNDVTYTSINFQGRGQSASGAHKEKKFPDYINMDPKMVDTVLRIVSNSKNPERADYAEVAARN